MALVVSVLQELEGKHPDFPVSPSSQPLSEVPFLCAGVVAVLVNPTNDKLNLLTAQKSPVVFVQGDIGEVDQEDPTEYGGDHCHQPKDDEDPPPAFKATKAMLKGVNSCLPMLGRHTICCRPKARIPEHPEATKPRLEKAAYRFCISYLAYHVEMR